ncbi:MAG TPA: hypothetical protein VLL08_03520 [Kineosporiaceae bacterium]|nr:hypothetical protein [Kineosporiaceae bacterium]
MADPWWLIGDRIWAGPDRWLRRSALPMRGPVAAGGDPVEPERLPPGARTLAIDGLILPGLHDAHVHSGLVDLRAVRRGGIASVTDLGSVPAQVAELRRESLTPTSDLPVLELVGAFLTAPGGYPSDRSWAAAGSWREVRSVVDAEIAVAEQAAFGARAVKVAINLEAGPVPTPSVLAAIVAAAQARGLLVIAHAQGAGAVRMALTAGVDVLAHAPWTESLGPDLIRECARQTTWISTLHIHDPRGGGPAWDMVRGNLREFLGHGGILRYGTDLGNGPLPLGINAEEIGALQTLGLSVDELLTAMTGPLASPAAGTGPSRFVAGVAPCVLVNPIGPDDRGVGPLLAQAQVWRR